MEIRDNMPSVFLTAAIILSWPHWPEAFHTNRDNSVVTTDLKTWVCMAKSMIAIIMHYQCKHIPHFLQPKDGAAWEECPLLHAGSLGSCQSISQQILEKPDAGVVEEVGMQYQKSPTHWVSSPPPPVFPAACFPESQKMTRCDCKLLSTVSEEYSRSLFKYICMQWLHLFLPFNP